MTDKTREDFEAWAKSKGAPKEGWWIRQIDDGGYSCGPVDDSWNGYQAATQHSAPRIAELEAEVLALRMDAERYRWLRDLDHWPAPFSSSQEPEPVRGRDLDAAIDAAMLAAK